MVFVMRRSARSVARDRSGFEHAQPETWPSSALEEVTLNGALAWMAGNSAGKPKYGGSGENLGVRPDLGKHLENTPSR